MQHTTRAYNHVVCSSPQPGGLFFLLTVRRDYSQAFHWLKVGVSDFPESSFSYCSAVVVESASVFSESDMAFLIRAHLSGLGMRALIRNV